jgi:crotonobetaine/carnitine-CoA ligase
MTEYWNLPEKTAEAWRGGWYRSGDLVTRDADGFVSFVSRKAEAIRTRGYMINPSIVEAVLNEDAAVLESAVVGIPDAEFGEEDVKAFLVPHNGSTPSLERLVARCAAELPAWMVPRYWEVRTELPKTPTQKIAKAKLRAEGITRDTVDLGDVVRTAVRK